MSGYRVEPRIYRLVFEDRPGLEVRVRSVELGVFLDIIGMAGMDVTRLTAANVEEVAHLFDVFAAALVGWNLETGDGPVPATVEGLRSLEFDFVLELVQAWMDAIASVPGPLGASSNGGDRSLEASLPMAASSPSPPS